MLPTARLALPKVHARIEHFVGRARNGDALIIWAHLKFRPGYPEIGMDSKGLKLWIQNKVFQEEATKDHTDDFIFVPGQSDHIVKASCSNMFHCTDLENLLKAQAIKGAVIFGWGSGV